MTNPSQTLEDVIGYQFGDRELLKRALTHRSWIVEQSAEKRLLGANEQIEFLGDSLLGFIVSEVLFRAHPDLNEGQLTQLKSQLVCTSHLYACARELSLGSFLFLSKGEERSGGRERRNLLADALEALIAAIYLDGGMGVARAFITEHVMPEIRSASEVAALIVLDHKGFLQEQAQARRLPMPRYTVIATTGPQHSIRFTVEARIGLRFSSRAEGTTKKAASQMAAHLLTQQLNSCGWSEGGAVESDNAAETCALQLPVTSESPEFHSIPDAVHLPAPRVTD